MITLGNHAYHRREVFDYLDRTSRSCGPPTSCAASPGHGVCVVERGGVRLGVVNLRATSSCAPAGRRSPRSTSRSTTWRAACDHILVDFHAEATSEKVAMGWYLDGRVTAVVGTHTHVPTADARVLPGGTAYITDVGMTGPRGGVIGVARSRRSGLVTHMSVRFETSDEDPWLMAVLVRCSEAPKATRSSSCCCRRAERRRAAASVVLRLELDPAVAVDRLAVILKPGANGDGMP